MNTVPGDTGMDIVTNFIKQYYVGTPFIPRELFVPTEIEDEELISKWLSRNQNFMVKIDKTQKRSRRKTCGACK